jgi:S-adenosylmethionine decarboxylase
MRSTLIQNFASEDMKSLYDMMDVNVYQENIFHTKMLLKESDLANYDAPYTKNRKIYEEERI